MGDALPTDKTASTKKRPLKKFKGRKIAVPPKLAEDCPLYEVNDSPEFPKLACAMTDPVFRNPVQR